MTEKLVSQELTEKHMWAFNNNILLDTVKSLLEKINAGQFSIIQSNGIN